MATQAFFELPLTQGKVALVDEADRALVERYKWQYTLTDSGCEYAIATIGVKPHQETLRLHRVILGLSLNDGLQADHRNRNGLDNRRFNLRIATPMVNSRNRRTRSDNTSGCPGVWWITAKNRWGAHIRAKGVRRWLGCYTDKTKAIEAYMAAAAEAGYAL